MPKYMVDLEDLSAGGLEQEDGLDGIELESSSRFQQGIHGIDDAKSQNALNGLGGGVQQ